MIEWSQPGLLPQDGAGHFTAAMLLAIASEIIQDHGVSHLASNGVGYNATQLMNTLFHLKFFAAISQHLRHEWEFI
jgi:hypothetical protein